MGGMGEGRGERERESVSVCPFSILFLFFLFPVFEPFYSHIFNVYCCKDRDEVCHQRILSHSLPLSYTHFHILSLSLRSVYLFHTWMHNSLTQTQDLVSILNSTFCTYLLPTYLSIPSFTQTNTFFKKWANPASFCFYFLSFHMTNIAHLL